MLTAIEAASAFAGAAHAVEVEHRVAREDGEAKHRVDHVAGGHRQEERHESVGEQPEQQEEKAVPAGQIGASRVADLPSAVTDSAVAPADCQTAPGPADA